MTYKRLRRVILVVLLLIVIGGCFVPQITHTIDAARVAKDKRPIFVRRVEIYKDGGTTVYEGLGYQVIKWNMLTIHGTEFGYEIFESPHYRDVNDGPTKELKLIVN